MTLNQTFILAGSMLIIALALFGYAGKTAAQIIKENKQTQLESKPVTQATEKPTTPNYGAPYPFTAEQLLAQWIEVLELPAEQLTRANVERIFKVKLTEHRIYTHPKGRDEVLVKFARNNEKLAQQLEGKSDEEEIPIIEAWLRQQEDAEHFTWPMRPVYKTTPGKDWYFYLDLDDFDGKQPQEFAFYFGRNFSLAQHPELCVSKESLLQALDKRGWIAPFYYKDNRHPRIYTVDVKQGDQTLQCIKGFSLDVLSEKLLENIKELTNRVNKENQNAQPTK